VSAILEVEEVERFRQAISSHLGLQFEDAKVGLLEEVLRRRLHATGRSCTSYLHYIQSEPVVAEFGALADELTVPETYFFRHINQFHAFAQLVLPERMKERSDERRLRILSAGCASGEEAYTLAILLREVLDPNWDASVLAVDLNPTVLGKAQRGRFSTWSLRETPLAAQQQWFKQDAREVVLDDEIRMAVRFEQHNLAGDDPGLWDEEKFDVIFCRNVMMYFTPEHGRALIERISQALFPGGYLFLGSAETLRGLTNDFHLCHTHETFYYQRKADLAQSIAGPPGAVVRPDRDSYALASLVEETETWVDAIHKATERVQQLVEELPSNAVARKPVNGVRNHSQRGFARALELLQEEHFVEALDLVEALPPEVAGDADVLLLQAVLTTHAGFLTRAEEACQRLLRIDELSAGAHYVLALCHEGMGDFSAAVDHDRMAAYLDPHFAMPQLHLGLLARRAGDLAGMRGELTLAVALLEHEDSSRLLLFGGGFSRDALIALCRAEILASEGTT
jgi:chemotaxis protein methyltransferase CheR